MTTHVSGRVYFDAGQKGLKKVNQGMVVGLRVTIVFGTLVYVITTKELATRMDKN